MTSFGADSTTRLARRLPVAHPWARPKARLRAFCFPFAGGGASLFRSWVNEAPAEVEIYPVQLPGREVRHGDPPHQRIEPLVDALCVELNPLLDLPYVLFGYSMGAIIAFELGRRLGPRGKGPVHLFIAARRGPRRPDTRPPIHDMPASAFIAHLEAYAGTPNEILQDRATLNFYLPMLRADFAVCETYRYKPGKILDCPLTVFGGSADPDVTREDLEAWSAETSSSCRIHIFDGDHFFIRKSRAALLAATIAELSPYLAVEHAFSPQPY